jgi:uncharacterized membrane protein
MRVGRRTVRSAVLMLVAGLVLVLALPASARSIEPREAEIDLVLEADGSLSVTELLTFEFDGAFTGAYREIPLRAGETLSDVEVFEGGTAYVPGGCTDLGCSSPPGTFGVRDLGGRIRIVWHYEAADERRTFTISYRMLGLAKAADDVVDVNFKVWGEDWDSGLDRLNATFSYPGAAEPGEVRVWGHPASVEGSTSLGGDGVSPSLQASAIPAHQFVEMRVVVPRRVLDSVEGATVVRGVLLGEILAEEERFAETADRRQQALQILVVLAALAAFLPATMAVLFIYRRYGREPKVAYDREYEQEPPSDDPPAVVEGLLSQGSVDERGFTATVFDLVRRGVMDAEPVSVDRSTWMGMKTETITDLQLSLVDTSQPLSPHERSVVEVMGRVLSDGPQPLNEFRDRIREDAAANASTYKEFRSQAVDAVALRGLLDRSGLQALVLGGLLILVLFAALGGLAWWLVGPEVAGTVLLPLLFIGAVLNVVIFGAFAAARKGWVRRTREGALLAERWEAFRRYLRDFSRLEEAPAISLALWDRFLVYAIALGVAEEVLEAARLRAPEELERTSHLYWYGHHGTTGGPSGNAFAGLTAALSGAFAPPSSRGGGGGFTGGGGFGGGGGGGGGW